MKIIGTFAVIFVLNWAVESSLLDPVVENVRHIKAEHPPGKVSGVWRKKMLWKPRWVKEWKSSNVFKPVWKKFWGPVIIREWVPIPKPPPDWENNQAKMKPLPAIATVNPGQQSQNIGTQGHYQQANVASSGYQLPIMNTQNTQAETYNGHSSYGPNKDTSFDLNPPVDPFVDLGYNYQSPYSQNEAAFSHSHSLYSAQSPGGYPQYSDSYKTSLHAKSPTFISSIALHSHTHGASDSFALTTNHNHHIRHHYRKPAFHSKPQIHAHKPSSFKFYDYPPHLTYLKPIAPKPNTKLIHQASSMVSVVSEFQSTTQKPNMGIQNYIIPQTFLSGGKENFIQPASLVGEYHYTEPAHLNPTQTTPYNPLPRPPHVPQRVPHPPQQKPINTQSSHPPTPRPQQPTPTRNPQYTSTPQASQPTPFKPLPHVVSRPPSSPAPPQTIQQRPPTRPPSPPPSFSTSQLPHSSTQGQTSNPSPSPQPVQTTHQRPPSNVPTPPTQSSQHSSFFPQKISVPVKPQTPSPTTQNYQQQSYPYQAPQTPPPFKFLPYFHGNSPNAQALQSNQTSFMRPASAQFPNFKALPANIIETYHYIEAIPSNLTQSKAALIGNIHQGGYANGGFTNHNHVSIITPYKKNVAPHVAKMATAVVHEHIRRMNATLAAEESMRSMEKSKVHIVPVPTTTTQRTVVTVKPTTSSSIKKTLKAYLDDEKAAEKSSKVFIVTPTPNDNLES